MKDAQKWGYSLNGENFYLSGTREEAYQEGNQEAWQCEYPKFSIGRATEFEPHICAEGVLERVAEIAYDEAGDCAETYLDMGEMKREHIDELEAELNQVFRMWAKKYGYEPNFFTVADEQEYETVKPKEADNE